MTVENLPLSGALMLTPRLFADDRGSFRELFSLDRYRECGIRDSFVQDNSSLSRRNVLRGLHGAARMSKIVSVLSGSAYDVIVDVRPGSPTYRRWYGTTLSAGGGRQLYIPNGFLHGFLALEEGTVFWYKQSAPYDPAAEFAVAWNDAELGIDWPLNGTAPILSARDAGNPPLGSLRA
ncbi:MAG: dTDP-4-dehydrorhamnose 3,5-epimerase [Candidatus Cybelea sp.]|jgi:dTDP-4-dehydrorhamnose 3,5-epimerase